MMTETKDGNATRSPFVPLLLLGTAVLAMLLFQTTQLYREGDSLRQLRENQEQPLAEAGKLRAQLDGVAADTARLAEKGNANAQRVVEQLRKRGITINPEVPTSNPPQAE